MKKIARIYKPTGEITGIVNYQSSYEPNTPLDNGDYVHVEVPEDTNSLEFCETRYWKDGEFHVRDYRPGDYYYWKNFAWEKNLEQVWAQTRYKRDQLIAASDWTQMIDAPLTDSQKEAWKVYRQELRDLPDSFSTVEVPGDVIWPTTPS